MPAAARASGSARALSAWLRELFLMFTSRSCAADASAGAGRGAEGKDEERRRGG